MRLLTPTNLDESLAMLADGDGRIVPIAGGTDLLVSWTHRVKDDLTLMDLTRLRPALQGVTLDDDSCTIGGMATYWDVINHPAVSTEFPLLPDAARQVGAIQIQSRGTWAGNIGNGSPAADGVPVMMAYDATVELASTRGRREVRLDEYYTGYRASVRQSDELIVAIRLPRRPRSVQWFHKVGARRAQAITKVGVAVVSDAEGWRVVANSVAPIVCRCRNMEQALDAGRSFANPGEILTELEQDIAPIDDLRSTASYRATVLSRILFQGLSAQ